MKSDVTGAALRFPRQPICEWTHQNKYAYKGENMEGTAERVATALFADEKEAKELVPALTSAIANYQFLPGGRILAGAGTGRQVTLFNCYVMGTIPDNIDGIFESVKEAAKTMQQGGGIGYDFSPIRPKGAHVKGVDAEASGPLSFMDVWDAMCRTIMSAGSRRGAMMATMRCDHPDIEDFVAAKQDMNRLRMFNMSVLVTDAFMKAVEDDSHWDLVFNNKVYRTIRARELWEKILRSTYEQAEPGVIFIDRINALNPLQYMENISCSNPCGEVPLPSYGACLLGSINLASLIRNPFTSEAHLAEDRLAELVPLAVRALDRVIDISNFPLEQQRLEAQTKRRMGLGFTGLADALLMYGLPYGSMEAEIKVQQWSHLIQRYAYLASVDLAKEKGPFAAYDPEKYQATESFSRLDEDVRQAIISHGIRNSHLGAIAPTGTISLLAGNVSSGMEPVFAWRYTRQVLQADGSRVPESVYDPAYLLYCKMNGLDPDAADTAKKLPSYFVTTQDLNVEQHVRMQAIVQRYVDQSISKTVNCPESMSFGDFKGVYDLAYRLGCKGCTTYRPNAVTGSVLSTEPATEEAAKPAEPDAKATSSVLELPDEIEARRLAFEWPPTEERFYLNVGMVDEPEGGKRAVEVFVNTHSQKHGEMVTALAICISHVLRHNVDPQGLLRRLQRVAGQDVAWVKVEGPRPKRFDGIVQLFAYKLSSLLERLAGKGGDVEASQAPVSEPIAVGVDNGSAGASDNSGPVQFFDQASECPKCGQRSYIHTDGCGQCLDCGHSSCA